MAESNGLWTIQPLAFGEFPTVEKSGYTYSRGQGEKISSPAISFLLRSGEEKILVDTGPVEPTQEHHPSHTPLRRAANQAPSSALAEIGLSPEDFDTVVLTHLHYDHSQNLELFSNASFILQAEELRAAVDPVRAQRSMYEFALPDFVPSWMKVTSRIRTVRGDHQLRPGLTLLHLPGHTPGMQGLLVQTAKGRYVLSGDLVSSYDNLGDGPDDWVVPGIHTDVYACERSMERILSADAEIIPSHDWRVFDTAVYG